MDDDDDIEQVFVVQKSVVEVAVEKEKEVFSAPVESSAVAAVVDVVVPTSTSLTSDVSRGVGSSVGGVGVAVEESLKKNDDPMDLREDEEDDDDVGVVGVVGGVEEDLLGPSVRVYPLASYTFGKDKSAKKNRLNAQQKMLRRKQRYVEEGTRVSVAIVVVTHHFNHPHLLLFQNTSSSASSSSSTNSFFLPHTRLRPGEDVSAGVERCITQKLGFQPTPSTSGVTPSSPAWNLCAFLGRFWRPDFDSIMYPYSVPHCVAHKEVQSVYLVQLEEGMAFRVAQHSHLVATPLLDVYKTNNTYGDMIAALPLWLSRVSFIMEN